MGCGCTTLNAPDLVRMVNVSKHVGHIFPYPIWPLHCCGHDMPHHQASCATNLASPQKGNEDEETRFFFLVNLCWSLGITSVFSRFFQQNLDYQGRLILKLFAYSFKNLYYLIEKLEFIPLQFWEDFHVFPNSNTQYDSLSIYICKYI